MLYGSSCSVPKLTIPAVFRLARGTTVRTLRELESRKALVPCSRLGELRQKMGKQHPTAHANSIPTRWVSVAPSRVAPRHSLGASQRTVSAWDARKGMLKHISRAMRMPPCYTGGGPSLPNLALHGHSTGLFWAKCRQGKGKAKMLGGGVR